MSKKLSESKNIPVTRSFMPGFEEYTEEIRDLWNSRWLTNMGVKHAQLEEALVKYLKTPHVTLFANGHLALENLIGAMGLKGEVITTPFTFASTTHAIVRCGLEPVFCDITPEDYTINTDLLEDLITEKTCAILPVHVYGHVCNVDALEALAAKHKIKLIFDAAHAFGVTVNGRGIGTFGDGSAFSFHATKVFHTLEGGAVTYQDPSLQSPLNDGKNFGITGPETVASVGGNAKMNEFQAAMGICNLRHVEEAIERRRLLSQRYSENLEGMEGICLVKPKEGVQPNFAHMPVLFDGFRKTRDQVKQELEAENIFPRKYFYPLTSSYKCYEGIFDSKATPMAEYIADRILTLPLYPELDLDEVDRICRIINNTIYMQII